MATTPDPDAMLALNRRVDELMRQHVALIDSLGQGQRNSRRLARSVWRVEEEARRRLARELHDGMGQNLIALIRRLDAIGDALPPGAAECHAGLQEARALVQTTLDDTRSLSRLLRPQILDDLGLDAALHWLARNVSGVIVALDLPTRMPTLDDDIATLMFRLVQEALTNLSRHSGATHAWITLSLESRRLHLCIRDDGRGCDLTAALAAGSEGRSGGLGGMRDRVELFDGELSFRSEPGLGFQIQVSLPLPHAAVSGSES